MKQDKLIQLANMAAHLIMRQCPEYKTQSFAGKTMYGIELAKEIFAEIAEIEIHTNHEDKKSET